MIEIRLEPRLVRYLKRSELMPSEQSISMSKSEKTLLLSQSPSKQTIISVANTNKIAGTAPHLVTNNRLLNRAKIRNDGFLLRKPSNKLAFNISHETIVPLAVYG